MDFSNDECNSGWETALVQSNPCPACGFTAVARLFDGGNQPFALIGWAMTEQEATTMRRLPNDYVMCLDCGHIFNASFRYDEVPYSRRPCRMFNSGSRWLGFLDSVCDRLLGSLPADPRVVEIGYGDGLLLESLARRRPGGIYTGFDPHGEPVTPLPCIDFRTELYEAETHQRVLRPDMIIFRHILEHLANPLALLREISCVAGAMGEVPLLYIEVPCVDRLLEYRRTEDFFYEHVSQFTTESFRRMHSAAGLHLETIGYGSSNEVMYSFSRPLASAAHRERMAAAAGFRVRAEEAILAVRAEIEGIVREGKRIAVWGGTGKGSSFLNRSYPKGVRLPLVVDSDPAKVGSFVPGMGQEIQAVEVLLELPVDVILIPTQWRAKDIVAEMEAKGIRCGSVLIPHNGALVDFHAGEHPYR